jgi:hypothetical protein
MAMWIPPGGSAVVISGPSATPATPAPPTPALGSFDPAALLRVWAADEETRLDLHELAQEAIHSLHRFGANRNGAGTRWLPDHFRQLSTLDEKDLARPAPISHAQACEVLNFLAAPGKGPLHVARRRWPQALALAGLWDFGFGPDMAFEQAAQIAAQWLAGAHPDFRTRPSAMTTPQAAALVDQGSRETCAQALGSLFDFADQLGVSGAFETFQKLAAAELGKTHRADHAFLHLRQQKGLPPPGDATELAALIEKLWLGRAAPNPAPQNDTARPRPRI